MMAHVSFPLQTVCLCDSSLISPPCAPCGHRYTGTMAEQSLIHSSLRAVPQPGLEHSQPDPRRVERRSTNHACEERATPESIDPRQVRGLDEAWEPVDHVCCGEDEERSGP